MRLSTYNNYALFIIVDHGNPGARKDLEYMTTLLNWVDLPIVESRVLQHHHSTASAVLDLLDYFSHKLLAGDRLYIYFTGHGIRQHDGSGDETDDQKDEVIILEDGTTVTDDELFLQFCNFAPGTEIIFIADCCNSGSLYRIAPYKSEIFGRTNVFMHRDEFANLRTEIIYLGAAYDGGRSTTGKKGSRFTRALFKTFQSYPQIPFYAGFELVKKEVKLLQHPTYAEISRLGKCEQIKNCLTIRREFREHPAFPHFSK
ncbi:caspase family protein [Parapedobacter defluvii]|uniref:caspase family protein n=1 Tax=Parapedobacter defluvii TaxID=2045106 RepID=UPI0016647EC3|nr:caspase family protein [Parapedobacter defluvii]